MVPLTIPVEFVGERLTLGHVFRNVRWLDYCSVTPKLSWLIRMSPGHHAIVCQSQQSSSRTDTSEGTVTYLSSIDLGGLPEVVLVSLVRADSEGPSPGNPTTVGTRCAQAAPGGGLVSGIPGHGSLHAHKLALTTKCRHRARAHSSPMWTQGSCPHHQSARCLCNLRKAWGQGCFVRSVSYGYRGYRPMAELWVSGRATCLSHGSRTEYLWKVPAIPGAVSRDLRYCHPEDMGFMEGQGCLDCDG